MNQLHFGTDFSKNVLVPVASPYLPFRFKIAWSRASQKDVLSDPRPAAESGLFFSFLGSSFAQMFGQIFSTRVKKLSNTNLVSSRNSKIKKTSLPVDMRRSKTPVFYAPF